MESGGGLTRRRGGGGANTTADDEAPGSPVRQSGPAPERTGETSYTAENGHKIAFDPRDISESAERSRQPKLTLMEEILLIGLKDKQVGHNSGLAFDVYKWVGTDHSDCRAIFHSGMTTSLTRYEDAS